MIVSRIRTAYNSPNLIFDCYSSRYDKSNPQFRAEVSPTYHQSLFLSSSFSIHLVKIQPTVYTRSLQTPISPSIISISTDLTLFNLLDHIHLLDLPDLHMFAREFDDPLAKHILTPYPSSSSSNLFLPLSSINPAQWRALQSDVDNILNGYSNPPGQNQDDTPKVLRAFLKYLCEEAKTLLMQEIKQFNGKPALRQLRNFLVDSILKSSK